MECWTNSSEQKCYQLGWDRDRVWWSDPRVLNRKQRGFVRGLWLERVKPICYDETWDWDWLRARHCSLIRPTPAIINLASLNITIKSGASHQTWEDIESNINQLLTFLCQEFLCSWVIGTSEQATKGWARGSTHQKHQSEPLFSAPNSEVEDNTKRFLLLSVRLG